MVFCRFFFAAPEHLTVSLDPVFVMNGGIVIPFCPAFDIQETPITT